MESLATIESLIHFAATKNLHGADALVAAGPDVVRDAYNGIGPEWLREDVREKVTKYLAVFAPAAVIHDLRYEYSNGERYAFDVANMEYFVNCFKLARDRYAWYNPRRYFAQEAAWLMYLAVAGDGGWQAWNEAKAKREEREKISGNSAGENNNEKGKTK